MDWTKDLPVDCQAKLATCVIACEVLWLEELVDPFARTLATVLHSDGGKRCYMSYTHRGSTRSSVFTSKGRVIAALERHSCKVAEVADLRSSTEDGEAVECWVVTAQQVSGV